MTRRPSIPERAHDLDVKPLLISASDDRGGAARAAHRLHQAFRSRGVPSEMVVRERYSTDSSVHEVGRLSAKARKRLELAASSRRAGPMATHSLNLLPSNLSSVINRSSASVVNVHWIGHGAMSIADLGRVTKPVVMTLHDMWAFTGSAHYEDDSAEAGWRHGYASASGPGGLFDNRLDRMLWSSKQRHWQDFHVVTPSRWLGELASESAMMREWTVHVIPNALDLSVFAPPADRTMARQQLGLPVDADLVLFGSLDPADRRKGLDLLVRALGHLAHRAGVVGVVLGSGHRLTSAPVPIHSLDTIRDDSTLALLYAACDVTVVPSRQENLPQAATESLACGTPVVAFDVGGMRDVVRHGETGYLAAALDTDDLARGIEWAIGNRETVARVRESARAHASGHWSSEVVVAKYLEVFQAAQTRSA